MRTDGGRAPTRSLAVALSMAGNVCVYLGSLLVSPILAHVLGAVGRGQLAAGMAPVMFAVSVAGLGAPEMLSHFRAKEGRLQSRAVIEAVGLVAVAAAASAFAIVVARGPLSGGDPAVARLMLVGAAVFLIPTLLLNMARGAALGAQSWGIIMLERSIGSGARLLAVLTLALTHRMSILSAFVAMFCGPLIGGLTYLARLRGQDHGKPEATIHASSRLIDRYSYGLRIWWGSLSGVLLSRFDQLMMVPLAGARELGFYAVAVSISEVPLLVNMAFHEVTFSTESADNDTARVASASRMSTIFVSMIGLAFALAMPWLLPLAFGADFRPAVSVSLILIAAVVLGNPGSVAGAGLSAYGHPGKRSLALFLACICNGVLVLLLVPRFGAVGAALATLAGNLMSANLNLWFYARLTGGNWRDFYEFRWADLQSVAARVSGLIRSR